MKILIESLGKVGGFIASLFGIQDICTGDTEFDDRFVIKGNKVDDIQQLLNLALRKALLEHMKSGFTITDNDITYRLSNKNVDVDVLTEVLDAQARIVQAILYAQTERQRNQP